MTLTITLERHGVPLSTVQAQRVHHHLTALGKRLEHRPDPVAVLAFSGTDGQHTIVANLRLQLGPLGPTLISSQSASTPDRAARLAIQAIERQLERLVAGQRGEASFGVPSRRRSPSLSSQDGTAQLDAPIIPDDA